MKKIDTFVLKINALSVLFLVAFVIAGRYGIPYMFEKYGMSGDAVVTKVGRGQRGVTTAHYEFYVNGNLYRGSVPSHRVQEGDTILIWYFLPFPWINECHEDSVIK